MNRPVSGTPGGTLNLVLHEATTVEFVDGEATGRHGDDALLVVLEQERDEVVSQPVGFEIADQAEGRYPQGTAGIGADPHVAVPIFRHGVDRVVDQAVSRTDIGDLRAIDVTQSEIVATDPDTIPTRTCPSDPTASARTRRSTSPSARFMVHASSALVGRRKSAMT